MELYLEACQIDPDLVPFTANGPTLTPPIKDYIQVISNVFVVTDNDWIVGERICPEIANKFVGRAEINRIHILLI